MHVIDLGLRCNNACAFCAVASVRGQSDESPVGEAARTGAPIDGVVAIVGGEPTLHADLIETVRGLRNCGAKGVLLQTNARLLAQHGFAEALCNAGVDALDVSLHGSTAAMHDYHTGVPGSFRETLLGARAARAAGARIGITTVITRSNFRHLADVARVGKALGARAVHFAPLLAVGRARSALHRLAPDSSMVRPHLHAAVRAARALGLETLTGDVASSPVVHDWFAGPGRVPSRRDSALESPADRPIALRIAVPLSSDSVTSPTLTAAGTSQR